MPPPVAGLYEYLAEFREHDPVQYAQECRLVDYMRGLRAAGEVGTRALDVAGGLWSRIKARWAGVRLPVPDMAPCGDGGIMMAFDNGRHHLEFEVLRSGEIEVFYRCRDTNLCREWEYVSEDDLRWDFAAELALFAAS